MVNKVRLWFRKYMRHIILAISLALFVGVGLFLLCEWLKADITRPLVLYTLVGVMLVSGIATIVSLCWYRIPYKPIQQRKNPDKWLTARIEDINDGQYLMLHNSLGIDFVEAIITLKNDLPFSIKLKSLRGKVIINNTETNLMVQEKNNIELSKHSEITDNWRLYSWTDYVSRWLGSLLKPKVVIVLQLLGEDDRHRDYRILTQDYVYRC